MSFADRKDITDDCLRANLILPQKYYNNIYIEKRKEINIRSFIMKTNMAYRYKGICAVCGKEDYVVTVASRYGCCSHSLCEECLEKGREPYWNMVAYISCAGHFPDDISEEYQGDVRRQLDMYGISEEQFIKDVDEEIGKREVSLDYWLGADLDESIDMS